MEVTISVFVARFRYSSCTLLLEGAFAEYPVIKRDGWLAAIAAVLLDILNLGVGWVRLRKARSFFEG